MKNHTKLSLAGAVLGASIAALAISAPAQAASVKLGVLSCDVAGGWGYVLGSSKNLHCTFSPLKGEVEHYTGTVSKFGVDLGYTRGGVIIWEVVAPSGDASPGALEGGYAGATASASLGLGAGAHVLIGGFRNSVALQPVSITGETGLNIAAGIGSINLKHAH